MTGFLEAAREALRTLRTQRLRSFLTMFGVVWGTASIVFLISWGLGVQRMLEDGYSRVGKNLVGVWPGLIGEDFTPAADRRLLWFTLDDLAAVRRRVRLADLVGGESRMWRVTAYRQRAVNLDVRGVEPQEAVLRGVRLAAGRALTRDDVDHRRRVVVLGAEARRRLLGTAAPIGAAVRLGGQPFEVIGVLAPIGTQLWQDGPTRVDEQGWIPLSTFFAFGPRVGKSGDVVDAILLRVRDRRRYDDLQRELRGILAERLRISPTDEEAIRINSPIVSLRQLPFDSMGRMLLILGAATLIIGGIGVLNMMLEAVYDRRQEIGVRLAVGARRRDILRQFFLETFILTGIGGTTGIVLGVGGCWILARLRVPDLIPVPILRGDVVMLGAGVMTAVGIAAAVLPAWRAARVDPSVTLRAE